MSLSTIELELLETIFLNGTPIEAKQVANDSSIELSSVMVYLVELTRRGYVSSPQKDLYKATDEGKKALGVQPITKENAKTIVFYAPHDKAFNFYASVDKPLHVHAHSLQDFANKLSKVDLKAIEYHMDRNDFEVWFKCLGDQELAKKTKILKERKIVGEQLRLLLHTIVEQHCQELRKLTEQSTL